MYEEFYGLSSKPFQLNPDPAFYFASKQHQRAKAYLDYGVVRNEGFIVVTGEVGAGKTTIVRGLLDNLEASRVVAAQLVSTQVDAEDMLRLVAAAFGVRTRDVSKAELLMALEVFFVSQVGQGKRCLLIVDEAQNLTPRAVEELRMLSNFQFGNQALLQSFLVGQPEFRTVLQNPKMKQLRQRVVAACHIGPLDEQETKDYILHRLKKAGATDFPVFENDAYKAIFQSTGGIPRTINTFCDRLMLLGFLEDRKIFTSDDVLRVEKEICEESGEIIAEKNNNLESFLEDTNPALFGLMEYERFNLPQRGKADSAGSLSGASNDDDAKRLKQLEQAVVRLEKINLELLTAMRKSASTSV